MKHFSYIEDPINFIKQQHEYPQLIEKYYNLISTFAVGHIILKNLSDGYNIYVDKMFITIDKDYTICPTYDIDELSICEENTYRFIYIDVIVTFVDRIHQSDLCNPHFCHSMAIMINNLNHHIEVFEPNGAVSDWYNHIFNYIQRRLGIIYPNYLFISTSDFCPYYGIQYKCGRSICQAITLLFFWSRIVNANLKSRQLIDELMSYNQEELNSILDKFICYIYQYAEISKLIDFHNLLLQIKEKSSYRYSNETMWNIIKLGIVNKAEEYYYNQDWDKLQLLGKELEIDLNR